MKEDYLRRWICGWLSLAEGLVAILTLGIISPSFTFDYLCWATIKQCKKNKHETIILDNYKESKNG